jgi:hypothetical protein
MKRKALNLDREMVIDEFGVPSKGGRERWQRARRKPGCPRHGRGVQVISVSIEKSLLAVSDALAKSFGTTRARLIERGLNAVLAAHGREPVHSGPMKVETAQELADRAMVGFRRFGRLTAAQRWAKMIGSGVIDEEGRVARNMGGSAKARRRPSKASPRGHE